jgi:hypothetical protein
MGEETKAVLGVLYQGEGWVESLFPSHTEAGPRVDPSHKARLCKDSLELG